MKFILYDIRDFIKNDKTFYIVSLIVEQKNSKFMKDVFITAEKYSTLSNIERFSDISEFCDIVLNEDNYYININV